MFQYPSGVSTVPRWTQGEDCNRQGQDLAHCTPMISGAGQPPPEHLQNLISLLDALPVGRAARLHPGHEDAHVIAPCQPQPDALALEEADHPRVGAVPARGGRDGVRAEWADGGLSIVLGKAPTPSRPQFPQNPHLMVPVNTMDTGRQDCADEGGSLGCGSFERVCFLLGYIPTILHALTAGHSVDVIAAFPGQL